jgi:Tol biopolymer transport system component
MLRIISFILAILYLASSQSAGAQNVNRLVSTTPSNQPPTIDNGSTSGNPMSAQNGRLIVFSSSASWLVTGDTKNKTDIFLRDTLNQTTVPPVRVSNGFNGEESNGDSIDPVISEEGRYIAFVSDASNLLPGGSDPTYFHVYRWDQSTRSNIQVDVAPNGQIANRGVNNSNCGDWTAPPWALSMSQDGRFIAFSSAATNLVANGTNGSFQIFVRDMNSGSVELISVATNGAQANSDSSCPAISNNGLFVAFQSPANNLDTGLYGYTEVFLHDRSAQTTVLVSRNPLAGGVQSGDSHAPRISTDGRYVGFLTPYPFDNVHDGNTYRDVYVYDRVTGGYTMASPGGSTSQDHPQFNMSADGKFVIYQGRANGVLDGGNSDLYRYNIPSDGSLGITDRITVPINNPQNPSNTNSYPALSQHGNVAAFVSTDHYLVLGLTTYTDQLVYQWGPANLNDIDNIFRNGFEQ